MTATPTAALDQATVLQAIDLFVRMTGVNIDQAMGKWVGSYVHTLSNWDLEKQVRALQDAATLDPSLLTCWMLLGEFTRDWLQGKAVQAFQYVVHPDVVADQLAPARELWALLQDEAAELAVLQFQVDVLDALERVSQGTATSGDTRAWVENATALATLRRDALLAVDGGEGLESGREYDRAQGLELHTFLQGNKAPGCNPQLVNSVYEFWNVNSLLRAVYAPSFPEQGLAVALIRDPEQPLHSFFVLAIRNGDQLHVLTDRSREHQTHPLRKKMGRRPDREMDARASKWWFPYDLLDVAVSEDGKRLYANARTALVPLNATAAPLRALSELHPATQVWLCLVLDAVRQRFFREDRHAAQLSYTGEMVRVPGALASEASALVRHGDYRPLVLPQITQADLSPQAMADVVEHPAKGHNRWMAQRYQDQVPEAVLGVVGKEELGTLQGSLALPVVEDRLYLPVHVPDRGRGTVELQALDPTTFGPAERIEQDQRWLAQHNRMRVIQRLAVAEFARTKDSVLRWYTSRIQQRKDFLLDALAQTSLVLPTGLRIAEEDREPGDEVHPNLPWITHRSRERLALGVGPSWWSKTTAWGPPDLLWVMRCPDTPDPKLFLRETPIPSGRMDDGLGVFGLVSPNSALAVAGLCGCEVSDLPWQLQRYHVPDLQPHTGNHILQRLYPEDFCLSNPWCALDLRVGLGLTRSRANARRKAQGLPRLDWDGLAQAWREG